MKSINFLVITYLFGAFGGAQEYDFRGRHALPIPPHHLQHTHPDRSSRSIESQSQPNQTNSFVAAGKDAFPNCQIYGRSYCTEIEGYPE